tara:strand:+ start:518 stop:961 length:444 start_codon:yes stop_codon:yes gene_type:complete
MEEKALSLEQRQQILSELATIDTTFEVEVSENGARISKRSGHGLNPWSPSWEQANVIATFAPSLERWIVTVNHTETAVAVDVAGAIAAMGDELWSLAQADSEERAAEAQALLEKSADFEAMALGTGAIVLGTARGTEEEGLKLYGKA